MKVYSIEKNIDNIIELVFKCKFNEVIQNTVEMVEHIENNIRFSNKENKEFWEKIMYYLTIGLENKDYLLVGDILKYELKPMLQKENLM
ncbi:hypothetical protein [Clostridium cochlearium]|uniref:hypothetical protein n=1 Tax=Clostridium cochlearium TaxID=1494 RepID=UPI001C0F0483|nr:hypothetical protein [Clostridium cochlearium]MBU5269557.1 hypothetical protein [Clostridium cochlearium]